MNPLIPDAEKLYAALLQGVRSLCRPQTRLAGIASGGAWLAQRLHRDLARPGSVGILSSSLHRDDFATRGLASSTQTTLPFEVGGADIVLIDDVLHTGRTTRAVLNELFDYGRPACVRLAVLVEREGRELPMAAAFSAMTLGLPATQLLALAQSADGRFYFEVQKV